MGRNIVLASVGMLFLIGCTVQQSGRTSDADFGPTAQGPAETSYCSSPVTFSAPFVTITGTANFNRRDHFGTVSGSPGTAGLGSADPNAAVHPASVHPIRYAEVRVTNSSGTLVTCTETKVDGTFSFTLPQDSATYTIAVSSRSYNIHLYASVLNLPTKNKFYTISTTVVADSSKSAGTIVAAADGDVLAGAFNILDQLLNANLFLVNQVSNCSASFTGCADYDPTLHKIYAYWMKGFNPNDYFGSGGGGLSFYLPGYSRLFILGGISGNVDSEDTDHFDSSVIVHEYGHFLEDNWLETDSPGGMHDGDEIIDPRLAWSEGWGDFFQAAVRTYINDPDDAHPDHYIDTMGNVDGTTEMYFYVSTETNPTSSLTGFDYTANLGEGNFREFSVTRLLYDIVDTVSDSDTFTDGTYTDNISGKFPELWAALSKSTRGFRDPNFAFRNPGLMLLAQDWLHNHESASDWSDVRGLNRSTASTDHYAQYMIPSAVTTGGGGNCASSPAIPTTSVGHPMSANTYYFTITPTSTTANDGSTDTGSLATSNMFANNRFYHLHVASGGVITPGSHTLQLVYQDDNGSGNVADLDLYLYNDSAQFAVGSDIIAYSRNRISGTTSSVQTETLNVNLTGGNYLLNVNVYTGGSLGGAADYNLKLDGVVLCPGDLLQ